LNEVTKLGMLTLWKEGMKLTLLGLHLLFWGIKHMTSKVDVS
jgi:hypothetical protein